jgi:hypothetical protein
MADSASESPALDPRVPNVARMYDYMLGGKENYASDRAAVARLIEVAPAVPAFARHNREFLRRAVRFVAGQGVSQFLDVGAGLPTQESVHQVARALRPVCVLLVAILHFVTDAEDPARLVAEFRAALAPGSYLIVSHGTAHGAAPDLAARSGEASRVYDNATARIFYRDRAQVSQYLQGLSLVEPGLVHISQWRPPAPAPEEFDGFLAAVGRVE